MPIYEFRCDNGHTFEVMQRMTDDPIAVCETCSAPVQRVFHPVAVHFKGSGFYNTDYGKRKRGGSDSDSASSSDSGKDAGKEKKESKATDSSSKSGKSSTSDSSGSSGSSSTSSSKD
jgi:putative FmdB family regulatory protein